MTDSKREALEILKSREKFITIFQTIPDPVTITRLSDGKFIEANDVFCRVMGYTPDEVIGKSAAELNSYADLTERDKVISRIRETGEVRSLEIRFRKKGGVVFMAELFACPIDIEGEDCIIAIYHDITERKKIEDALRESGQKLRTLLDQTFQFIGLMTPDGTLIDVNRTALEFSGIRESDVIGRPFWETPWWAYSPELQERLRDAIKRGAQGEFVRFEATHPAADSSIHSIDFSLKPVKDDEGTVVFLISEGRDITDNRSAAGERGTDMKET
jgi:PAS domain S-box-containing protein